MRSGEATGRRLIRHPSERPRADRCGPTAGVLSHRPRHHLTAQSQTPGRGGCAMEEPRTIRVGMSVQSADGEQLGTVVEVTDDALRIAKGLISPKEYRALRTEVQTVAADTVTLRQSAGSSLGPAVSSRVRRCRRSTQATCSGQPRAPMTSRRRRMSCGERPSPGRAPSPRRPRPAAAAAATDERAPRSASDERLGPRWPASLAARAVSCPAAVRVQLPCR